MIDLQLTGDESKGVSPVIAVILMVAITVILAAVIGMFVLDLGDNSTQQNAQVGLEFNESQGSSVESGVEQHYNVEVTIISLGAADEIILEAPKYAGTDSNGDSVIESWSDDGQQETTIADPSAGASGEVTDVADGDGVTVVGILDGQRSVLQNYTVEG